jgi:hypothetical protein
MLIQAAFKIRQPRYRFAIFLFFLLGAYMMIPYEFGDIRLYTLKMERYSTYSFFQFLEELGTKLIGQGEGGFEFFVELNLFLTSRFTQVLAYSFCLTAIVVFFAWQAIVMRLVKEYDLHNSIRKNKVAIFILISFALYIIFFRAINGRFYLAYWIFIYSFYQIITNRNNKYYLLLLCTVFVHQSFIFLNLLVFLFRFTAPLQKVKRFETILFILIVLGTIFSQTGLTFMNQYLGTIGGDIGDKYSNYTKDSYVSGQLDRDRTWFQTLRTPLLFFSLAFNVLWARFNKKIEFDESTTKIYFFSLIFWIINAFTINVPSFGDRFRNVLMGVFLLLLFKIYNTNFLKKIPISIIVLLLAFIFYKLISLKILEMYLNKWLFFPFSLLLDYIYGSVAIGE